MVRFSDNIIERYRIIEPFFAFSSAGKGTFGVEGSR